MQLIKRPKLLFNILSITRSTILAKKDFYSFEPYLIEQYERAKTQFGFNRNTHFYKLSIVYMICHVLYRNRKFDKANEYLKELKEGLYAHKSSHIMLFYPRYILLSAAVNCYRGNLKSSINLLRQALEQDNEMFSDEDQVKLQLNLSIYHFMAGDIEMSLKTGMSFEYTEKWFEKNIGKEWVFKKQLMEVIIQVELGNEDIAMNRIRAIERASSVMFNHPLYSRAKSFLDLIKKYINNPIQFREEETQLKIEKHLTVIPEEKEDLQAMTFYAWLKAKYLNRNYYEVLLEIVKPN
jgi:ATP/maltotriose-dependent transcriptional regulator MalT